MSAGIIRKKSRLSLLWHLLLLLLVYLALRAWLQRDFVDGTMPIVSLPTLSGEQALLAPDPERPTLIYFWATWCSVCKLQHGTINNLARDHRVLSVATRSGSTQEVSAFAQERGLEFPILLDTEGRIADLFGVNGVPASFVLAPDGEIIFAERGYTSNWGLRLRLSLSK